ncbi:MAG: SpoIIE family protein phosphatase [Raineya sp.]|jgi:serine phosphatase RsbU (regulator of sigma subunit)|nr:SpoIIE family protein phosphatase [Raineya sp.]
MKSPLSEKLWKEYYHEIGRQYALKWGLIAFFFFPIVLLIEYFLWSLHTDLYFFRLIPSVVIAGVLLAFWRLKFTHELFLFILTIIIFLGAIYYPKHQTSSSYLFINLMMLISGAFFSILSKKWLSSNFLIFLFIHLIFLIVVYQQPLPSFNYLHALTLIIVAIVVWGVSLYRYNILKNIFLKELTLKNVTDELHIKNQQYAIIEDEMLKINEEVMVQNEQLKLQKEELVSQRDAIEESRRALEVKNRQIISSIQYSEKIQEAILPNSTHFQENFHDFFIYYKPRDIVSGDFFWLHQKENLIWLALADCTGHGVPGALMTMLGSVMLTNIVFAKNITHPEQILQELNKEVYYTLRQNDHNNASKDGMDISLCLIDKVNKKVEFSLARHALVYFQNDEMHILRGSLDSIGGWQSNLEKTFNSFTISTHLPTTLYLFSDGFQDQFGGERTKKYSSKKFYAFLERIHSFPMKKQQELIETEWNDWTKQHHESQIDDVTIIGFKL